MLPFDFRISIMMTKWLKIPVPTNPSFHNGGWLNAVHVYSFLTKKKVFSLFEFKKKGLIDKSFYISEQLDSDLTFRDLTQNVDYPDHENILRAFTRFTNKLHNKGVLFLDHSPGNTLIKKKMDSYDFYLVDLNRMKFGNLSFDARISNFKRLTIHASMIETMSA